VIDVLRQVDLFDDVPEEALARLAGTGVERRLEPGEFIVALGEPAAAFIVLVEGRLAWTRVIAGEETVLATRGPITYAGAVNLLTGEPSAAGGRSEGESLVVLFDAGVFQELLRSEPSLMRRVAALIAPLSQGVEAAARQREKLVALGTLSAGLAHELNNPAAAARRTAAELARSLATLQDTIGHFVSSGVERVEAEQLVALQQAALARPEEGERRDAVAAADREDALGAHLDGYGVEGWRLAEPLAAAGLDAAWVDAVAASAGPALPAALDWVAASLTARGLVAELHDSTVRISEIVGAVKEYTYMDRGDMQEVDLHHGLESTLVILGHKLRHGTVRIERDYAPDLPHTNARGSELNQVWTNLLDNAIDAVAGNGTITIRTCSTPTEILVEIGDDGPGIPPEVAARIFEPFYTTKGVGSGTGLGLDIARRIVVGHGGDLRLDSPAAPTRFEVRLPIVGRAPS
jgi:signal transduction histidine kinase